MNFGPNFDAVLAAAQANGPWAFRRLYEWLAGPVVGFLRAQGVEDPDDVASEVFLSVFAGLASFSGTEAQFRSWVFTIAYRRLADARRVPVAGGLGVGSHDGARPAASAEEAALEALGTEGVEATLAQLPPDQRDVLALRVVADLTVEQVAAALGKRPGAVKALQRRGLAALRRQLADRPYPSRAVFR